MALAPSQSVGFDLEQTEEATMRIRSRIAATGSSNAVHQGVVRARADHPKDADVGRTGIDGAIRRRRQLDCASLKGHAR
jgi:hypothetical protein